MLKVLKHNVTSVYKAIYVFIVYCVLHDYFMQIGLTGKPGVPGIVHLVIALVGPIRY